MRTRLDEIVEEEWVRDSLGFFLHDQYLIEKTNACMKRIAERAFRHGVERGWQSPYYGKGQGHMVQPAPAEEKVGAPPTPPAGFTHTRTEPTTERIAGRWYGIGVPALCQETRIAGIAVWELIGAWPAPPGRRKGERRKGLEAQNWVHGRLGFADIDDESRPIYQVNDHGSFQYDRRSGKDRRKP